jgi:hypothetical protein
MCVRVPGGRDEPTRPTGAGRRPRPAPAEWRLRPTCSLTDGDDNVCVSLARVDPLLAPLKQWSNQSKLGANPSEHGARFTTAVVAASKPAVGHTIRFRFD